MRLVVDANLSPTVAAALRDVGFDASHVADHDLLTASDKAIFDWADRNGAAIITADSDFAMLLAFHRASSPSVVHVRRIADSPPAVHAVLLIDNLDSITDALKAGAIVSLSATHLRIRDLPIR